MPRLHKYVSRDSHYVLTNINGSVVTYQLTPAGERKLGDAGIVAGQNFERAILLDLYRTGDAYAPGVEFPEAVLANQLEIDFAGDPSPESAFPGCDMCGSVIDLHLTLSGTPPTFTARLQCPTCRATPTHVADTSIPLSLLSRSQVLRLFEEKGVTQNSENVLRYLALLDAELVERWKQVRKDRAASQPQLFGEGELGGFALLPAD